MLKDINLEYPLEGLKLNLKLQYLATWCEDLTHWKRPWFWERLRTGGWRGNRGWDGWMSSPTQWTRVWENSRRQWKTGKPHVLQFMESQRIGHNLGTIVFGSIVIFTIFLLPTQEHGIYLHLFMSSLMSCNVGGNVNWNRHYGRQYGVSFKKLGEKISYDPTYTLRK